MRKTHLEVIESLLKKSMDKIYNVFNTIRTIDPDKNVPVNENLVKSIFTPEISSKIFAEDENGKTSFEQRNMFLSLIYHTYHTWKDKNYFDTTLDIINRLKDTDLKDLDTFFLKSPFRSMYVSLPKGNGLYIPGASEGKTELYGFYITLHDFGKYTDFYSPLLKTTLKDTTKRMKVLMCAESSVYQSGNLLYYDLIHVP